MLRKTNLNTSLIMSVFLAAMVFSLAEGRTIYVDDSAAAGGNGESWVRAYKYLQNAIAVAYYGDRIVVAQGIYRPDEDSAHPSGTGNRKATFQLKNGVALKGGYAGLERPQPGARNYFLYETVLSGDLNADDGPDFSNNSENSYHVITGSWTNATAILEGFTITSGNANEGPLFPEQESSGGGLWNYSGDPIVQNCIFSKNSAMYGGGVGQGFDNTQFINCTFSGNAGWRGGGMFNYESHSTLQNCLFIGNSATNDGGGIHNQFQSPKLFNCTLNGNRAAKRGGGIYDYMTGSTLTNCIFWGNSDKYGGGESSQFRHYEGGPYVVNYCCVQGWTGTLGGVGNIGNDPLFGPDDIHLSCYSPCIDTGTNLVFPPLPSTDLDGNPRILNGIVDMGAFEGYYRDFLVSTRSIAVPEGGTAIFTVKLLEDPLESLEVTVSRKSGDPDITIASGELLTFDSSNYDIPQTVVLTAAEDPDRHAGKALIWIMAPRFFSAEIMVSELDNEPPIVVFVDAEATGINNGLTWADAFNHLQDALAYAVSGDEICVAGGVYKPDQGICIIPGDRMATFQLKNGVALKGGYAGFGEPDPNVRDIGFYETILSGDLAGNDRDVNDPRELFDDPCRADNSYHVVTGNDTGANALLDGFIVTGGNANRSVDFDRYGGGILIRSGSPTLISCIFRGNLAEYPGGGMYNRDSSNPTLTNCIFTGNCSGSGGGICNDMSSNPRLINCTFTQNSADSGAGVANSNDSSPALIECTFHGNSAGKGGGIANFENCSPTLINCTFSSNSAEGPKGTIYGGGMYNYYNSSPTLINCKFIGNSASFRGGGIYGTGAGPLTLVNCIFTNNSANSGGGIFGYHGCSMTIINCVFVRNLAYNGCALAFDSLHQENPSNIDMANCVLWDDALPPPGQASNPKPPDGATGVITTVDLSWTAGSFATSHDVYFGTSYPPSFICNQTFATFDPGAMTEYTTYYWRINESNAWGKTLGPVWSFITGTVGPPPPTPPPWPPPLPPPGVEENPASTDGINEISNVDNSMILITYSNIRGGSFGEGNIDANPCFVEPGDWDANGIWIDGDYHLLPDSPCINAGDNISIPPDTVDMDGDGDINEPIPFDLDGNPRIVYDVVDMGAYEFFNTPPIANAGPNQVVECACNTTEGTKVTLDGSGSYDADGDPLTYTWMGPFIESPAHGAAPTVTLEDGCPGDYVITLVVDDGIDESEPNEVVITVVDTTPPEFELSVSPMMLWPPDHKMVEITPSWTVSDECDPSPDVSLVSIMANEGDDIIGDGHTSNDIQIDDDGSIFVRSERSGTNTGRIYTITYQAVDDCGNTAVRSATVSIPHDFKMLARIASRWLWAGPAGSRIPEDLNGDGIVNLADFARFANNWIQ